jgi:Tfp pilus assembly protein PilV
MSELKLEFVGKQVKDMYGTFMGKVVGIVTDTDGSIESVGVDCGSSGLKQLAYEQLLIQGDYVIYIPRWRLDAQKLLRQKNLTLQRIKGLQDIVAENDLMKDDAELVYIKYEKRLHDLEEKEKSVIDQLQTRLNQLDTENKSVKTVLFDAKLQYRSNEVTEDVYQQINISTQELIEHINLEKAEINNVKTRLAQQTLENVVLTKTPNPTTPTDQKATITTTTTTTTTTDSDTSHQQYDTPNTTTPQMVSANVTGDKTAKSNGETETSWLNQVIPNE